MESDIRKRKPYEVDKDVRKWSMTSAGVVHLSSELQRRERGCPNYT